MEEARRWRFLASALVLLLSLVDAALGQDNITVTVVDCVTSKLLVRLGETRQLSCEIRIEPAFPDATLPIATWYMNSQTTASPIFQLLETIHPNFDIANTTYPSANSLKAEVTAHFTASDTFGEYEIQFQDEVGRLYHTAMFVVEQADFPAPPRPLESSVFQSNLKVIWEAVTATPPVSLYEVQRGEVSRVDNTTLPWATSKVTAKPSQQFQVALFSALKSFTRYRFRMRAENALGWSNYSSNLQIQTLPYVPKAPTSLAVINTTQTSVTLQWQLSPEHGPAFGIIRSYVVAYRMANESSTAKETISVPDNQNINVATIHGLQKGTEYMFSVMGTNGVYSSGASESVTAMTNTSAPGNYSFVNATVISHEWVLLELGDIDTGGPPITKLAVTSKTTGNGVEADTWVHQVTLSSPTAKHIMVRGLQENTTYRFRVAAHNVNGKGKPASFSDWVTTHVLGDSRDAEDVSFVHISPFSLRIRWSSSPCPAQSASDGARHQTLRAKYGVCAGDAGVTVPRLAYIVRYRLKGTSEWTVSAPDLPIPTAAGGNSSMAAGTSLPYMEHVVKKLKDNAEYEIRVLGRNVYGPSSVADILTVKTRRANPLKPRIATVAQSGGDVVVNWEVKRSSDEFPVLKLYAILKNSQGEEVQRVVIPISSAMSTGSTRLSGLLASKQYTVFIEAENEYGNSFASLPITAGTDAPPSGTPPPEIIASSTRQPSSLSQTNLIIIIAASVLAPTILLIFNLVLICACRRRRKNSRKRVWNVDGVSPPPPAHPSPPPPAWSLSSDNVTTATDSGLAQRSAWDNRVHTQTGFESTTSLPAMYDMQDRRGLADVDEEATQPSNIPSTFTSFGVDSPGYLPPPPLVTA